MISFQGDEMKCLTLFLTALLIFSTKIFAQSSSVFDTYLMVAHGCDTNDSADCSNPSNHTTHLLESSDGSSWVETGMSGLGSVPDIASRGNYLYIYNPGNVAVIDHTSSSAPSLSSTSAVSVVDGSGNAVDYVDPSIFYDSITGKFVMFYLDATGINWDPAQCDDTDGDGVADDYPCTKEFRSATEVTGSGGTQFLQNPGFRQYITLTASDPVAQFASDPDIFYDGTQYVLLISRGQNTQIFTSTYLRGKYSPVTSLNHSVLIWGHGVASGHYDSTNNEYWIYAHDSAGVSSVRQAIVSPGSGSTIASISTALYITDFSTVANGGTISGTNPMYYMMASPGILHNN